MKTLTEWLETGMLTGLAESDYHEVVVMFNRILYHADSAAFKTKVIEINSYIIPLIRRVYDELKTISIREKDDGVVLQPEGRAQQQPDDETSGARITASE